jgi:hypothetical protein
MAEQQLGVITAYGEWLNAGNTGTKQDFLNSLQGAPGPQGATGATGPKGDTGDKGDKGDPGELFEVFHDDTLSGNGTQSDPLSVIGGSGGNISADQVSYTPLPNAILEADDVQDVLDQVILRGVDLRDITGLNYAGTSIAGILYKATPGLPPNYNQSVRIINDSGQKVGTVNISNGGDMWLADASDVPLVYLWQAGTIIQPKGYVRLIDYFDRLNKIEYKFSPNPAFGQRRGFTVLREVNAVTVNQEMGILSKLFTSPGQRGFASWMPSVSMLLGEPCTPRQQSGFSTAHAVIIS